jgi:hypothetical protein
MKKTRVLQKLHQQYNLVMKIFIYYKKVKSSKTYNIVFIFYVLCYEKMEERKMPTELSTETKK